jgi:hypothetical protein
MTCSTFPATRPPCTATTTSPGRPRRSCRACWPPSAERAWILVGDLEVQALLNAGNLPVAIGQLEAIHQQAETRAAANSANTEWQRDLSFVRQRIADLEASTPETVRR